MANASKGIRHEWSTSGFPNSRSGPERCGRCGLERRAVASTQLRTHSPSMRAYWRYGEEQARTAGPCTGAAGAGRGGVSTVQAVLTFLLALAVASCAASGPSQTLERGTLVAPPPAQRPGVGAPVVGQPGQHARPELPRSPHARALPPSNGPGLWEGGPRASSQPERSALFLGTLMALPEEKAERRPALQCLQAMNKAAMQSPAHAAVIEKADKAVRECIAALTYHTCLVELLSYAERDKNLHGIYERPAVEGLRRAQKAAKRQEQRACGGVSLTDVEHTAWVVISRDAAINATEGRQ